MKKGLQILCMAAVALLFSACGREWPKEASVVRGMAAPDTELRFDCGDGKVYRTRTLAFGTNSRFSLSLPMGRSAASLFAGKITPGNLSSSMTVGTTVL
ncbi:hypothetical protein [Nitratifractor sp.]